MPRHRAIAEGSFVLGVVLSVVSVLTTWTRSGRRDRNGIATLESLDRLGVLDRPWDLLLVVGSASLPLMLALGALGVATSRRLWVVVGAGAGAVVLVGWAVAVGRSPVGAGPGPLLAVAAALALGVTVIVTARADRPR